MWCRRKNPNISELVKKTVYNTKTIEIENQIHNTNSLATNTALTVIENKITDVSTLVQKADYDAKISEIENKVINYHHDKYITTSKFSKLTTTKFATRIAQSNLVTKTDFDNKLMILNKKITSNKKNMYMLKMNWEKHLI